MLVKDIVLEDFQTVADELLARNRSLLDILSKMQDSCSRTNRATIKAITHCGCVSVSGEKQQFDEDAGLSAMRGSASTQLNGELCQNCREHIEEEIGAELFYLASLCNALDISLYDVALKEKERLSTLGKFHMR